MALFPFDPVAEDAFRFGGGLLPGTFLHGMAGPRIDVYESGDEIIASCELPGLESKDDVNIDVDDNVLTISGRLNRTAEVRDEHVYRRERYTGSFQRSIALPGRVQAEKSWARYKNGILEIHMPKERTGGRKRVDVNFS